VAQFSVQLLWCGLTARGCVSPERVPWGLRWLGMYNGIARLEERHVLGSEGQQRICTATIHEHRDRRRGEVDVRIDYKPFAERRLDDALGQAQRLFYMLPQRLLELKG
jgi:hypothetical protein